MIGFFSEKLQNFLSVLFQICCKPEYRASIKAQ